jgi:hypothetical protein
MLTMIGNKLSPKWIEPGCHPPAVKWEIIMFKNNLIVGVKANNKVLREVNDTVYIPFGQEYKISIKNNESRRVQIKVWIDGVDATEGTTLVLNANSNLELERFIKSGNLKEGNKFKFIERTANIEAYRGTKIDDGFIKVEFQYEDTSYYNTWNKRAGYWDGYLGGSIGTYTNGPIGGAVGSNSYGGVSLNSIGSATANSVGGESMRSMKSATVANVSLEASQAQYTAQAAVNDVGITVPGAKSEQQFTTTAWFPVESTKHVMTLKILGETEKGETVVKPVEARITNDCSTCGRKNKKSSKFCSECGTSLTIY